MFLKHTEILKSAIYSINCPNIILYGHQDINKLNLLLNILNELNSSPLKIINDKIIWKSNSLYKIFNMECINNKNINCFYSTLNELIHSKNFYLNYNYRIIIFNNFNKISYNIQNKLRVIIEKYRLTSIFILITNNFTSVINPIKSLCLSLRIPSLTPKKKSEISKVKILDLSYDKRSIIYDKIYQINNKNEIEYYSEFNEGLFLDYKTIYEKIYERIKGIYHENKLTKKNIEIIREISYMIQKYNLYNIYKELLSLFISDPKYTYTIKIKLILFFSNSEYNYQKSYRSLVHIENLFIQLFNYLA